MNALRLLKGSLSAIKSIRQIRITKRCKAKKTPEEINRLKFSESQAYYGIDKDIRKIPPKFHYDYFTSDKFKKTRRKVWASSLAVGFIYFYYIREPSDVDALWETPSYILKAEVERRMLRKQIAEAKKLGKSTALLEEELDYVDVKEQALKASFDEKEKVSER